MKAWVTKQIISEIGTKSNTSGCQGREVEFLERENIRYFALTVYDSQTTLLYNFYTDPRTDRTDPR